MDRAMGIIEPSDESIAILQKMMDAGNPRETSKW